MKIKKNNIHILENEIILIKAELTQLLRRLNEVSKDLKIIQLNTRGKKNTEKPEIFIESE